MYHRYNYNFHADNDRYREGDPTGGKHGGHGGYGHHGFTEEPKRKTSKLLVCFDSKFRQNPEVTSSSDFIYNFPYTIKNVLAIRLASIEIPVTWYTFSKRNKSNRMFLLERDDALLFQGSLSIPMPVVGPILYDPFNIGNVINYTTQGMNSLKTQLNGLTVTAGLSVPATYDPLYPHFDMFMDMETSQPRVVIENLMSIPFEISFPQTSETVVSLKDILGFQEDFYTGSSLYRGEIPLGLSISQQTVTDEWGNNVLSVSNHFYFTNLSVAATSGQKYAMNVIERDESLYRQSMIHIAEGNYNSSQFSMMLGSHINETLRRIDIDNERSVSSYYYVVKVDENSGKTTIASLLNQPPPALSVSTTPSCVCHMTTCQGECSSTTDGAPFDMHFKLGDVNADITKNMGWLMGFRKPFYTGKTKYTSEGIFVSNETDYVYFVLDEFSNCDANPIVAFLKDSYIDKNIMARVAISVEKFSIIYDDGRDTLFKKREYNGPINISKMRIKILDLYGELFDLNNMDFSFTLEFEILDEFTR